MRRFLFLLAGGLLFATVSARAEVVRYQEPYRPQFHFTAETNWHNDPNGLVFFGGEYHLFFQHNPAGIDWGNMTWGHAVSADLIHWRQLEHAIHPDEQGTIFSGSAVIDKRNSSGLGEEGEAPMVCVFTYAGAHAEPERLFTQALAWSTDGRTFSKYQNNPILGNLAEGNRDPKVFWHEPTRQWVMVLYVRRGAMHIFNSGDLKSWELASICEFPEAHECPELFELPVDGNLDDTRWVIWEGAGRHMLGRFDGTTFTSETTVLRSEWGSNCYAGQTWNSEPKGRRVFIGWMRGGKYPGMPFNQQMSFPRQLALRTTPAGIRLHQSPIEEIKNIYRGDRLSWTNLNLEPGADPLRECSGDLWDVRLQVNPSQAGQFRFGFHGHELRFNSLDRSLSLFEKQVEIPQQEDTVDFRVLIDRTSIEIFVAQGRIVMSFCFIPEGRNNGLSLQAVGDRASVESLSVQALKSIWE